MVSAYLPSIWQLICEEKRGLILLSLKYQYRDIFILLLCRITLYNMVLFEKMIFTLSFIHALKSVRARVDGEKWIKNRLPVQWFLEQGD